MQKKSKAIIIAICGLIIIGISGVFAYLTDTDTADNIFTVGKVKIDLQEPAWENAEDNNDNGIPDNAENITPNATIAKDPQVKNIGENNAYIYLKVTVPAEELIVADENGILLNNGLAQETQIYTYTKNENWTELEKTENVNEETGKIESYTYVYYYNTELAPEATTDPLFNNVKFANVIEGQVDLSENQINIQAYAIQSENLPEGTTIESAYTIYVKQEEPEDLENKLERLADVVAVGDYVNYDANSGLIEPITYTTDSTLTGNSTSTTFSSNNNMEWRVLSVDREAGTVELISADPTSSDLYLSGRTGYINAEDVLNDIGAVYGHGKGATGGRSINKEDVEQYSSYDPYTYENSNSSTGHYGGTKTYTSGIYFVDIGDGAIEGGTPNTYEGYTECIKADTTHPVIAKQTHYFYSAKSYFENETIYNMLFRNAANTGSKNPYWLASRCVNLNSSDCDFIVCCVYGGIVGDAKLAGSGYFGAKYRNHCVVPVVSLESNILTSGKNSSGVWQLKVE